jgi:filamentous hemagglutinin
MAEYSVAPTAINTTVTINRQLPPNLAQQQINPLTLPGFSLPTGQNGLFRLSSAVATQANTVAQNWVLGGASITAGQRDQAVVAAPVGNLQIGSADPTTSATRQLANTARDSTFPPDTSTSLPQGPTGSPAGASQSALIATAQTVAKVQGHYGWPDRRRVRWANRDAYRSADWEDNGRP